MMCKSIYTKAAPMIAGALMFAVPLVAIAQEAGGTKTAQDRRAAYDNSLQGKTIGFMPVSSGVPLMDEWARVIKESALREGMKFVRHDPNMNPAAMQQIVTAFINDKVDVLVVQNASLTLLQKELKRAEEQGIYVIQVNMASNYNSTAYVGVDWWEVGHTIAEDVVKECGTGTGMSGKVQIVQGELTAPTGIDLVAGMMAVFDKDKAINVVSNQSAQWDANNAMNITTTVLQQHPDLCASVGTWTSMQAGAGQAVKNANKVGQVRVYAVGDGSQDDCDLVTSGNHTKILSGPGTAQGHDMWAAIETVLQTGIKPGAVHLQYYTHPVWIDKNNANLLGTCFANPKNQ